MHLLHLIYSDSLVCPRFVHDQPVKSANFQLHVVSAHSFLLAFEPENPMAGKKQRIQCTKSTSYQHHYIIGINNCIYSSANQHTVHVQFNTPYTITVFSSKLTCFIRSWLKLTSISLITRSHNRGERTPPFFPNGTFCQARIDYPTFKYSINPLNQDSGNTKGKESIKDRLHFHIVKWSFPYFSQYIRQLWHRRVAYILFYLYFPVQLSF